MFLFYLYFLLVLFVLRFVCSCGIILIVRYYTNESINVPVHRSVPDVKLESVMNDYSDIIIMPGRNYDRLNDVTMFFLLIKNMVVFLL